MAIYTNTKTITKAVPTVFIANNVVKKWDIEFTMSSASEDGSVFSADYQFTAELENGLPLSNYNEATVLGLIPAAFDDVFDAHYVALSGNVQAPQETTATLNDFVFSGGDKD